MIKMIAFFIGVIPWQIVYRTICNDMKMPVRHGVALGLLLFQWVGVLTLMYQVFSKNN